MMKEYTTRFTQDAHVQYPIICGAMYPCSNPELVAAASEAGALGVIQPLSLTYVYGYDLRDGIKKIKSLTNKPVGFNALVEKSSRTYELKMREWVDIAIEEGIRFFITALGNPSWVVEKAHAVGGVVYHDVINRHWGLKAKEYGVDGLICVNARAGGHAGRLSAKELYDELADLGLPLVCAGGISTRSDFMNALELGYDAVQMGTRFIASVECQVHDDYKKAIVQAREQDIVLTDKISGVPVAVIKTPLVERLGTRAHPLARWALQHPKLKHYMRLFYLLRSFRSLKKASLKGLGYKDFFQAGKSVAGIHEIKSVKEIIADLVGNPAP